MAGLKNNSTEWRYCSINVCKPQSEVPSDQTADWQCQSHTCVVRLLHIHIPAAAVVGTKKRVKLSFCVLVLKLQPVPANRSFWCVHSISQSNLQLAAECHMCQLNFLWLPSLLASLEACGPPAARLVTMPATVCLPCFLRRSPAQATPVATDHDQCWLAKVNCIQLQSDYFGQPQQPRPQWMRLSAVCYFRCFNQVFWRVRPVWSSIASQRKLIRHLHLSCLISTSYLSLIN